VFVCANDPSCPFHLHYNCHVAAECWRYKGHQDHNCSWSRAVHDRLLDVRKAEDEVKGATATVATAWEAVKVTKNAATKKGLSLAKEHLKLCEQEAKEFARLASARGGSGATASDTAGSDKTAPASTVMGSVWGLKPTLAAELCDHLWENGKEPKRGELKKFLKTIMATEPTTDYLRRVRVASLALHSEVPCCKPCSAALIGCCAIVPAVHALLLCVCLLCFCLWLLFGCASRASCASV
jgi:hypothetical protein